MPRKASLTSKSEKRKRQQVQAGANGTVIEQGAPGCSLNAAETSQSAPSRRRIRWADEVMGSLTTCYSPPHYYEEPRPPPEPSLTNLDTSHRLLPSRFRRSRQRSLNPRARMCRSSSIEVRRPASSAYLIVWVDRGCRWRDRGVILRNPLSGGMRHLYRPAVRTDGGATGVWRGVSVWKNSGALDVEPGSTWSVLDDLGLFQYHKLTRKRVV